MREKSSNDSITQSSKTKQTNVFRGGETKVMKKSLSILLALAMVFSMFASVAAAEETEMTAEEKFDALKEKGIFNGYDDGLPHLEDNMTREQAAKIIALVFELDLDTPEAATFSDVAADRWSYEYVEAAAAAEIINGVSEGVFAPTDNVTVEQFAKMIAVGYATTTEMEIDMDATTDSENVSAWAQAYVAFALEAGLIAEQDDYTVDAIRTVLVEGAYVANAKVEELAEAAKELKVESITADSLVQVVIEFNAALDAESAEEEGNYDLSDSIDVDGAELQEDGKTVVLTVEELDNQDEYKIEIDGVTSAGGNTLEEFEGLFTAFDADLPTVEGLQFTGPKSFTVTFSEPMDPEVNGEVEVKKGSKKLSVDKNDTKISGNEVFVELNSSFKDGEEYSIAISKYEDFAEYGNVSYKENFDYEDSKEVPTASIEDVTQTVVEVKFDKPVSGVNKDDFNHTYTGWKALYITETKGEVPADVEASLDNVTTLFVVFDDGEDDGFDGDHALPSGTVEFTIASGEIEDNWGNEFEKTTYELEVAADRDAPTVTGVEVESGTSVEITFNESVKVDSDNYKFLDSDGEEVNIDITAEGSDDNKTVTLTFEDDNQEGETLTLVISDVVDDTLYENEMEEYSEELVFDDLTFDLVDRVEFKDAEDEDVFNEGDDLLYIIFNEAVSDSAIDSDNYRLYNGTTLAKLEGEFEFFEEDHIIQVELTSDDFDKLNGAYNELVLSNIEDVNGNGMDDFQVDATIVAFDSEDTQAVAEVSVTGSNEVTIEFDQRLENINETGFSVTVSGSADVVIDGIEEDLNDDGNTVLKLTLDNEDDDIEIPTDASGVTVAFDRGITDVEIANIFGVKPKTFNYSGADIADGYAPELIDEPVAVTGTNTVTIEFTENMDSDELYKGFFEVNDETPTSVSVSGAVITLTVADDVLVDGEDLEITIDEDKLADDSGNFFEGDDDITLEEINTNP
ncbi:Ig-like domain-containing protein [Chengkuizengella sediminis]|uniref:Ig-like domain-containing protein n=1 Tax=Chengkuizengella sediminis TaxID=1885917 RepID=UPI00138A304D|nr:Ig-like domain-containing protein [Chengkuizengella sediminis]NDI34774.1 Ig-like domain-containing protein [Chengkuizengella sediminis]